MQALPTVIVLAAGRGERFLAAGGTTHKLAALIEGRTVLEHTLAAVVKTQLPFHVVRADPLLCSMGDSIAAGVAATSDSAGWLFLPADLPAVLPETIAAVAEAIRGGALAARPVFGGQGGHPVGFAASKKQDLLDCKGFPGAAQVFSACVAIKIEVTDEGCVCDVDTPQTLGRAAQCIARREPVAA